MPRDAVVRLAVRWSLMYRTILVLLLLLLLLRQRTNKTTTSISGLTFSFYLQLHYYLNFVWSVWRWRVVVFVASRTTIAACAINIEISDFHCTSTALDAMHARTRAREHDQPNWIDDKIQTTFSAIDFFWMPPCRTPKHTEHTHKTIFIWSYSWRRIWLRCKLDLLASAWSTQAHTA